MKQILLSVDPFKVNDMFIRSFYVELEEELHLRILEAERVSRELKLTRIEIDIPNSIWSEHPLQNNQTKVKGEWDLSSDVGFVKNHKSSVGRVRAVITNGHVKFTCIGNRLSRASMATCEVEIGRLQNFKPVVKI